MAGELLLSHQLERGTEEPSVGLGNPFFPGCVGTPHPEVEETVPLGAGEAWCEQFVSVL